VIIKRNFYNQNTIKVAKDLLGCFLVREHRGKIIKAIITETEAYRGRRDLASHASRGRTQKTEIMFGHPGHAYIYMIYGMYFMLNVVTEEKDFPAAILIRGIHIIQNSKFEIQNSKTNGPGKLTKYLNITKNLNGWDLTKGKKLWIEQLRYPMSKKYKIVKSPRIGIDYARHCRKWKWNFKII
jgi:DNA-3-methyladenine glycosylase